VKIENITRELAADIVDMYGKGVAFSDIAKKFAEQLDIKEKQLGYGTGYRIVREAYIVLSYSNPPHNFD